MISAGALSRITHLIVHNKRYTVCDKKLIANPFAHKPAFRRTHDGEMAIYPNTDPPRGSRLCVECFSEEFIAKHIADGCCTEYDPNVPVLPDLLVRQEPCDSYNGDEVDIGVGVICSPCHNCGRYKEEHVVTQ